MYAATGGYPYFIQAYGKAVWDLAPRSPITADDVAVAAPEAEAELAVGFFGSRFERATPGEREYLRAMADVAVAIAERGEERARRRSERADRRRRRRARQEAAVALPGARRAAQEGPDLLRRARPDRVHGAALRALPARARLSVPRPRALVPGGAASAGPTWLCRIAIRLLRLTSMTPDRAGAGDRGAAAPRPADRLRAIADALGHDPGSGQRAPVEPRQEGRHPRAGLRAQRAARRWSWSAAPTWTSRRAARAPPYAAHQQPGHGSMAPGGVGPQRRREPRPARHPHPPGRRGRRATRWATSCWPRPPAAGVDVEHVRRVRRRDRHLHRGPRRRRRAGRRGRRHGRHRRRSTAPTSTGPREPDRRAPGCVVLDGNLAAGDARATRSTWPPRPASAVVLDPVSVPKAAALADAARRPTARCSPITPNRDELAALTGLPPAPTASSSWPPTRCTTAASSTSGSGSARRGRC